LKRQKLEGRNQKSEVRSQKSEVRSQKSEVRNQKSEIRSLNDRPSRISVLPDHPISLSPYHLITRSPIIYNL